MLTQEIFLLYEDFLTNVFFSQFSKKFRSNVLLTCELWNYKQVYVLSF